MKRTIPIKTILTLFASLSASGLILGSSAGIGTTLPVRPMVSGSASAAAKGRIDTPQIFCTSSTKTSINITVCAPDSGTAATGMPAGFSLQWMTCTDYAANGNQWFASDDPRLCKASFSANANSSRYRLAPGQCVTVNVGDFLFDNGASTDCAGPLQCDGCYVFRAFGHATNSLNRSDFTNNLTCSTVDCTDQCEDEDTCEFCNCCVIDAIHWQVYGPPGCAVFTLNQWPATSLTLGTVTYTDLELCEILNTPANGNGLLTLGQELVAAKLNQLSLNIQLQGRGFSRCSGYTCEEVAMVARCLADADAFVGSRRIPPFGTDFVDPAQIEALIACLHAFNAGLGVDGCPG
jgi:hypothetical protein